MPTDLIQFTTWKSPTFGLQHFDTQLVIVDKFLNELVVIRRETPRRSVTEILTVFGFKPEGDVQ